MKILNFKLASLFLLTAWSQMAFAQQGPADPVVTKTLAPSSIAVGGTSVLTITVKNTNGSPATLANFTDTFPTVSGVPVFTISSSTPTVSGCGAGVVTATLGTGVIKLTGGTIGAGNTCSISVNVTGSITGSYTNQTGPVAFRIEEDTFTNMAGASAMITITPPPPPTVSKQFIPSFVDDCGTSTLVITLTNPSNIPATLSSPFTDRLPRALLTVGSVSTTCTNGVAFANDPYVTLQSGTIPANGSCTIIVEVCSECDGVFHNKIPAGALVTNNGSNAMPAFAELELCCVQAGVARESCLVENTTDEEDMSLPIEENM